MPKRGLPAIMSAISKILVQQTRLEIFRPNKKTQIDIKGWIANQQYYVDNKLSKNYYEVRASDKSYLKSALANDCNRMATAAIESISGLQLDTTLKKSGAWGVIRAYYATFFAIHSIMRMYGISCSQLDQPHVNKIYEAANAVGQTNGLLRLERGFYAVKIDENFSNVSFHKYTDSHKDTWGEFLSLLQKLTNDSEKTAAISKYKIEAIDILTSIKHGITKSRCIDKGNWLSTIRNSVNYQHSHGVWYPYERKAVAPDYIATASKEWKSPISASEIDLRGDDLKVFFELTTLILSLLRELLISCNERADNQNPTFRNGSLKLLNSIQAK